VSPTDELARSYLDLRWHFDPAAGSLEGAHEQDSRLGMFDAASVREHLAAFRSLEAAAEALDVESADEEIDHRAHRRDPVAMFRLQHERPGARTRQGGWDTWRRPWAGRRADGRTGSPCWRGSVPFRRFSSPPRHH
jgi:hypothetical protein